MRKEDRLLFEFAGEIVESRQAAPGIPGKDIDWQYVHRQAVRHEIIPVLYLRWKEEISAIPDKVRSIWEQTFYASLARSQCLQKEFLRVSELFRQAGLRICGLKGVAFLQSFLREYPARTMTDIDLFIPREDIEQAVGMLEAAGYCQELHGLKKEYWTRHHYHLVLRRDDASWPSVVELHWGLDYPGQLSSEFYDCLWARAGQVTVDGRHMFTLSPEDHFISLALHLRRFGNIFNLKHAIDAGLLIRSTAGFDWDYVVEAAASQRFRSAAECLLLIVRQISPGSVSQRLMRRFCISPQRNIRLEAVVKKGMTALDQDPRSVFFGATFLMFDSLTDVRRRFSAMPQEQFAKFFELEPYAQSTRLLHAARFFSAPFLSVAGRITRSKGHH